MKHALPKCTRPDCEKTANFARFENAFSFVPGTEVCKDHIESDDFKPLRSLCEVCREKAPSYGLKIDRRTHCRNCATDYNKNAKEVLISFRKRKEREPKEEDVSEDSEEEYERVVFPERPRCPREKKIMDSARNVVNVIEELAEPLRDAVKRILVSENVRVISETANGYDVILDKSPNVQFVTKSHGIAM